MEERSNTVVISVSSILKRDKLIRQIYAQLTSEPTTTFTVQQDQVNRIKVFHNVGDGVKVLIKTYLVIVIPIIADLSPLLGLYGSLDFHLDDTINTLSGIIQKLQALKGHKMIKGNGNDRKNIERQLARLLS